MNDIESTIRTLLAGDFPAAHVATEAPADITGPTVRSVRSGGVNNLTLDRALLDVDCFDLDRDDARKFAEQVRDWFMALSHTRRGEVAFTIVETTMAPRWLPWDNTDVRRFGATYQLYCA